MSRWSLSTVHLQGVLGPAVSCRPCRTGRAAGFTLIELMTALSILAIVVTLTVPGMATFIQQQRLSSLSVELGSSLALARAEAIQRGQTVIVVPADASVASDPYRNGWRLVIDTNASGAVEASDTVLRRYGALPDRLRLQGPATVVFSASTGYLAPTVAQVFTLCPTEASLPGSQVTVAPSGLADAVKVSTCP